VPEIPLEFVYGLAAGLALAVGLYLLLRWLARRSASAPIPPGGAVWVEDPGRGGSNSRGPDGSPDPAQSPPPPTTGNADAVAPPAPVLHLPPTGPNAASVRASTAPPASGRSVPATETLRLSQRVILHVYALGVVPPGETAPPGLCQAGIVDALGIPQAGLAAVLRRLEAAGVLTTERGHVRGHDRRLKVYRLSDRGLEIARELRTRAHRRPVAPSLPGS
jgi:DNA-binding MarR family transcriptional regulator